jgi:hypothetical protein
MADIGVKQQYLVSPDHAVEQKWLQVQIQERKSRIARYKQDIEDCLKGRIIDLEAKIMMLEKEIQMLGTKEIKDADLIKEEDSNG